MNPIFSDKNHKWNLIYFFIIESQQKLFRKYSKYSPYFSFGFHLIISILLNILTLVKSNSTTGIQNSVLTFHDQWMHHNYVQFTSSYIFSNFILFRLSYIFYFLSFFMKVFIDSLTINVTFLYLTRFFFFIIKS